MQDSLRGNLVHRSGYGGLRNNRHAGLRLCFDLCLEFDHQHLVNPRDPTRRHERCDQFLDDLRYAFRYGLHRSRVDDRKRNDRRYWRTVQHLDQGKEAIPSRSLRWRDCCDSDDLLFSRQCRERSIRRDLIRSRHSCDCVILAPSFGTGARLRPRPLSLTHRVLRCCQSSPLADRGDDSSRSASCSKN